MEQLRRRGGAWVRAAENKISVLPELLYSCGFFAVAFLLAHSRAAGAVSPLGFAFAVAAPAERAVVAASGAALGYAFAAGDFLAVLRALVTVLCIFLIRAVFMRILLPKRHALLAGVSAGLSCLLTGAAVLASRSFSPAGLLQYGSEALAAGALAPVFSEGIACLLREAPPQGLSRRQGISLVVCGAALLTALGQYQIRGVTPAHILSVFLLLCAAMLARESGGAVAGICIGAALFAANRQGNILVTFCVGGLLAGLFAPLARLAPAGIFLLVSLFGALIGGKSGGAALLFESAAACALFAALPQSVLKRAAVYFRPERAAAPDLGRQAQAALQRAAAAMGELNRCVCEVAEGLDKQEPQPLSAERLSAYWQGSVCVGCAAQGFCWEENRKDTEAALESVLQTLRGQGYVLPESFPVPFAQTCPRTPELAAAAGRCCLAQSAQRSAQLRASQLRAVVTEQFQNTRSLLCELAEGLEKTPAREAERFWAEVGLVQYTPENAAVCGDYYAAFRDANGNAAYMLSDGMGTGSRAAVDSAMATELFVSLAESGLSFDCALRLVNTALLVKSAEESLATLDIVSLDLTQGRAEFCKAGAAASFVRSGRRVLVLEQASLPAGILQEVQFARSGITLSAGDAVLLVSDGAVPEGSRSVQDCLRRWQGGSAQELAECAAEAARSEAGERADDMTVLALVLHDVDADCKGYK